MVVREVGDARREVSNGAGIFIFQLGLKCIASCPYVLGTHDARDLANEGHIESERLTNMVDTKMQVCKKTYTYADGETGSNAKPNATKLDFAFSNGESRSLSLADFETDILHCLTFFGISEKLGNSYAGAAKKAKADGEEVGDVASELFDSLYERLVLGQWVSERESGGARIGDLVAAYVELRMAADNPIEPTAVITAMKDETIRKTIEADPVVVAKVAAIRSERAAEKAAKAAEAAQDAAGESLDLISADPVEAAKDVADAMQANQAEEPA